MDGKDFWIVKGSNWIEIDSNAIAELFDSPSDSELFHLMPERVCVRMGGSEVRLISAPQEASSQPLAIALQSLGVLTKAAT